MMRDKKSRSMRIEITVQLCSYFFFNIRFLIMYSKISILIENILFSTSFKKRYLLIKNRKRKKIIYVGKKKSTIDNTSHGFLMANFV